jgi:hypothetical protein
MKAVLVPPPLIVWRSDGRLEAYPPLGIISLATVARQQGHAVAICDLNVERCRGLLPANAGWDEAAAEHILTFGPDVVGFGTICSGFPASIAVAKALKARRPSLPVLMGGPQASLVVNHLLREVPEVDFVLTGESDHTFARFLEGFHQGRPQAVPGMAWREGGAVRLEPGGPPVDLNALPMCDYGMWPLLEAWENGWFEGGVPIDAGRGCPFRCSFCSTSLFFRRRYRIKSASRLEEEIRHLYRSFGFTRFRLTHDSFTTNRNDVVDICRVLAASDVPGLSWTCSARVDAVDSELLKIMWKGGCRGLFFGVETGTPRMQKAIQKNLDMEAVETALSKAFDLGFRVVISCIVGFPEEKWEDVEGTLRVLLRWSNLSRVYGQVHLLAPQNGTPLLAKYGDRLQFDSWYPDASYFNTLRSEQEIAFVRDHPELCPHCHYIPNPAVGRRALAEIREYFRLMLHSLPGLGPYVHRTESSVVGLVQRWRRRCAALGLPAPDRTNFFWISGCNRFIYLKRLLEVLGGNRRPSEIDRSFLSFWATMLALEEAPADAPGNAGACGEGFPSVTRHCLLAATEYDVYRSIREWREHGAWHPPARRRIYHLFVKHGNSRHVCELSRVAAMIFNWCDGRHSVFDMYALVDSLADAETVRLKRDMGTVAVTHGALAFIRAVAGLGYQPIKRGARADAGGRSYPEYRCKGHPGDALPVFGYQQKGTMTGAGIRVKGLPGAAKISEPEMKSAGEALRARPLHRYLPFGRLVLSYGRGVDRDDAAAE